MSETTCICGAVDDPEKGQGHNHGATKGMDFGRALFWLKKEQTVRRAAWGAGMMIVARPATDAIGAYFVATYAGQVPEAKVNWMPQSEDLFAEDWELV